MLCPQCRAKLTTHHLVQCTTCQSIIDFLPIDYNDDDSVVYYVEKCSHCSGSKEDDRRVKPYNFPEAFI